ncbi:hypothetical protein J6590_017938 [Homalodisca vitripennis]|nr:hypothetical protein J6590_017938 [Homalodisca vitripennis]
MFRRVGPQLIELVYHLIDRQLRRCNSCLRATRKIDRETSAMTSHGANKEKSIETRCSCGASDSGASEPEFENTRELRLRLQHCQEENSKLQAVITDLTQVNKRWQKYNNDRQLYVQKLLSTIQDQQEQLNLIGERSYSSSAGQSSASSSSSEAEVERLRSVEQKLKEKVSILEFQVKAHRDDWEAELNEKKQALKDKESAERKLAELRAEMQIFSTTAERGEARVELYCQNCGQMTEVDRSPPSRSRMYRTAVHLPCSSSRHSSSTSISTTGDELVIDSRGLKQPECGWNILPDDTSYSRCSTVPLVSGTSTATTTYAPNSVTLKSFVQIPITKSSSVPEGSAPKFPELPRMSLDSFNYSSHAPPVTVVNSADQYEGTETLSSENVICLRCGRVFPPNKHLEFLDHFPKCHSSRSQKVVSSDSAPNVI